MADQTPTQDLINHLAEIALLLPEPAVAADIGQGLVRETTYLLAAFRARFPDRWPGAQREIPFG